MKKIFLSLLIVLALVFSCCTVVFAALPADDNVAGQLHTSSISTSVNRESRTSGYCTVNCNFPYEVNSYTVTTYLQKLYNGSWVHDTTNSEFSHYKTGKNSIGTLFDVDYHYLKSGTTYRVKVVSKTIVDDVTYTATSYSKAF